MANLGGHAALTLQSLSTSGTTHIFKCGTLLFQKRIANSRWPAGFMTTTPSILVRTRWPVRGPNNTWERLHGNNGTKNDHVVLLLSVIHWGVTQIQFGIAEHTCIARQVCIRLQVLTSRFLKKNKNESCLPIDKRPNSIEK